MVLSTSSLISPDFLVLLCAITGLLFEEKSFTGKLTSILRLISVISKEITSSFEDKSRKQFKFMRIF